MTSRASKVGEDLHRPTQAAVSLLHDWNSFESRLGAANFLRGVPSLPDSCIATIWRQIYCEPKPGIVATLIEVLGNRQERAADSVPLIAYHLTDPRPEVTKAAVSALCNLSRYMEHALAPLVAAKLGGNAAAVRDDFLIDSALAGDARVVRYIKEHAWIKKTPRQQRAQWIDELPPVSLRSLSEPERARFLLLYADPKADHVVGCLKMIRQWQVATPDSNNRDTERYLSACEGSFFREMVSFGQPNRTRFLAKALTSSKPFSASLAYPLGMASGDVAREHSLSIKADAMRLAPETPPEAALQGLLDYLWCESDKELRSHAIDLLNELMPELGERSAQCVIDDVFDFLGDSTMTEHSVVKATAGTIRSASNRDVPYILGKTRSLLASSAPRYSKICALDNLSYLHYTKTRYHLIQEAATILQRANRLSDQSISHASGIVLSRLAILERSIYS